MQQDGVGELRGPGTGLRWGGLGSKQVIRPSSGSRGWRWLGLTWVHPARTLALGARRWRWKGLVGGAGQGLGAAVGCVPTSSGKAQPCRSLIEVISKKGVAGRTGPE